MPFDAQFCSDPLNRNRLLPQFINVVNVTLQKDEPRSDRAIVGDCASLSKSLKSVNISTDDKMYTPGVERVNPTGHPSGERDSQQRPVSAKVDRTRLSLSSVSSCSNGEFIARARPHATAVHRTSTPEHDSSADRGSTLSWSQLRSMSREQVLRLLAEQQDEISRRETQLSSLNSGILSAQVSTTYLFISRLSRDDLYKNSRFESYLADRT